MNEKQISKILKVSANTFGESKKSATETDRFLYHIGNASKITMGNWVSKYYENMKPNLWYPESSTK